MSSKAPSRDFVRAASVGLRPRAAGNQGTPAIERFENRSTYLDLPVHSVKAVPTLKLWQTN
jgi:hypothetical protein